MASKFKRERVVKVTFDATGGKAIGSHTTGLVIPSGAIITDCFYDVTTTFTTASNDAGTIALTTGQNAGDLKAAIAVSAAGDVWDAGLHHCLPGAPAIGSDATTLTAGTAILFAAAKAASMIKTTANRNITVVIAGQNVTAGVMDIYVKYVY